MSTNYIKLLPIIIYIVQVHKTVNRVSTVQSKLSRYYMTIYIWEHLHKILHSGEIINRGIEMSATFECL